MSSAVAIDAKRMAAQRTKERVFHATTLVAALLVLVLLGGVAVSLVHGAWPAFARFKLSFLTRRSGTRSPTSTVRWARCMGRS